MAGRSDIQAGRAYVELYVKNSALVKGLDQAGQRLQSFGAGVAKFGGVLSGLGASMLAPFAMAIPAASEFEETVSKFGVVFGENTAAMREWSDQFAAEVGRSKTQIVGFLASSQDLLVPMGIDPTAAEKMSKTLTGLAVDLASFNNMQDADTMRDLQAALTGSGEVMKKYGVIVSQTAVNQELLNQGLDPKTATEAAKAQARLNIILAGTTAAQGDAVRTSGSFANQMKRLKASFDDTLVAVGTPLTAALAKVLERIQPLVKAFAAFAEQNDQLILGVAAVAAGITAAGIAVMTLGGGIAALGLVLSGASTVIAAIGTVLSAILSPIGLLTAAIAGGIIIWARYTESGQRTVATLQEAFARIAQTARDTFAGIWDAIAGGDLRLAGSIAMTGLQLALVQGFDALGDLIGGVWGETIGLLGAQLTSGDLVGAWQTVVQAMAAIWDAWTEAIVVSMSRAVASVIDMWEGAVKGIADKLLQASAQGGIAGKIVSTILGVDMQAEIAKGQALDAALGLDKTDLLQDATAYANTNISRTADALRRPWTEMAETAAAAPDEAFSGLEDRARSSAEDRIDELRQQLATLAAEASAAKLRAQEARAAGGTAAGAAGGGVAAPDVAELRNRQSVTFSAAAFQTLGGGDVQERIAQAVQETAKEAREQRRLQQEQLKQDEAMLRSMQGMGFNMSFGAP